VHPASATRLFAGSTGIGARVRSVPIRDTPRVKLAAMVDVWTGLVAGFAILGLAYALTSFFWRPELNVDRAKLGHWFRSLIRLYESDSLVRVSQRGSSLRLTLQRRAGEGSQCWVVLSCPRARWLTASAVCS